MDILTALYTAPCPFLRDKMLHARINLEKWGAPRQTWNDPQLGLAAFYHMLTSYIKVMTFTLFSTLLTSAKDAFIRASYALPQSQFPTPLNDLICTSNP